MSLFSIQLTPQQEAIKFAELSARRSTAQFEQVRRAFMREFDEFWFSEKYTPQQAADAFGNECLTLFIRSAATRDYLIAIKPDCLEQKYLSTPMPWQPETINDVPTGKIIIN
jgi:hypothetical protein